MPQKLTDRRNQPVWTATQISQTSVEDLNPYTNNVKTHSDKSITRLAEAISEFGFVVPVVVDTALNVVAGHGRVEAAKRLRLATIPTVCADHLTPAQVKAYRIAENRLSELSDWNRDALAIEFADLGELRLDGVIDFDLTITGFEAPEIDLIIEGAADEPPSEVETIADPDPEASPVTRIGDLWNLGHHRILCGNALEDTSYETLLADHKARMVITDPPYNVAVNGHVRSGNGSKHREFAMASGEMSDSAFRAFLKGALKCLGARLVDGGVAMVFMDWRHIEELI
ncbi:ParB-like nuclease domain-containing protein [Roseivivax halotolerans]|uniref:ParB-like nuclease domain-containing protein n=1 Tax=Roseivivax halotolerans TaxID=93684 RepID=A0A1I5ZGI9_9RHOB|nr:ParB/Srx family N-terminal domain-containing protein [Roseivivax halotolerans]SFQ55572.1 ParB-like nuclease domain-containing protein [Roseivivax halotolerans]